MFCVDTVLMYMCTRRLGSGPPFHDGGNAWLWGRLLGKTFCFVWRRPAFLAAGVLYTCVYIICELVYLLYIYIYMYIYSKDSSRKLRRVLNLDWEL